MHTYLIAIYANGDGGELGGSFLSCDTMRQYIQVIFHRKGYLMLHYLAGANIQAVVQEAILFKDISYLDLRRPFCSAE